MEDVSGRIELVVRPTFVQIFFWPLLLWPPTVSFEGRRIRGWWLRRHGVDARPGVHEVMVVRPYGTATVRVLVEAGETTKLTYNDGMTRFAAGPLRVRAGIERVRECYGYRVGARVQHAVHGAGTIQSIEVRDEGISSMAHVRFDDVGVQQVDLDLEDLGPS